MSEPKYKKKYSIQITNLIGVEGEGIFRNVHP